MLDIGIFDTPNRAIHNLDELLFFKNIETFDKHFDSLLKSKNNKALFFTGMVTMLGTMLKTNIKIVLLFALKLMN